MNALSNDLGLLREDQCKLSDHMAQRPIMTDIQKQIQELTEKVCFLKGRVEDDEGSTRQSKLSGGSTDGRGNGHGQIQRAVSVLDSDNQMPPCVLCFFLNRKGTPGHGPKANPRLSSQTRGDEAHARERQRYNIIR